MNNKNSNRQQCKTISAGRILSALFCFSLLVIPAGQAKAGWEQVSSILSRIKAPKFPNRDFKITNYGAVADNETDCTDAFEQAISAAHQAGGGRVVMPQGTFLMGPIHLKNCTFNNVEKSNILIGVENLVLDNVKINGESVK